MSRQDKGNGIKANHNHIYPHRKRWFAFITLGLVIGIFIVLEAALRVFHYGSEYDLVTTVSDKGKMYYCLNPSVGKRYFDPAQYFLPKVEPTLFEVEKSPGTFRVFCLGASTTAGFPYSYNLTPSQLLKKQLEIALPGRRVEVINAGLTATSSYTVVEFARELADYKPDLFVIYSGQNEFYGALAVGSAVSIGQFRWLTETYLQLRRLKTFVLIEETLAAVSHAVFGSGSNVRSGTLMQQMAKEKSIPFGSPMYRRAMESYRKNLEAALDIAKEHDIPVVLSTLVTNERSLQPFVSMHDERLTESQTRTVEAMLARGEQLQRAEKYADALAEYRKAASIDSLYALTQFRIGQCCEQIGAMDQARRAYAVARDADGLRFRASGEANRIIRALQRSSSVVIADYDSAFRTHSPGGIPGKELLWEHVHPTLDGYLLLSRSWYRAAGSIPFVSAELRTLLQHPVSDSLLRTAARYTPLDAEFGALTMEKLLHRWPFTQATGGETGLPRNDLERVALQFINSDLRWNEAHYELADSYLKTKNIDAAVNEYAAVSAYYPDDPFPLIRMGDMYALLGNNVEAEKAFSRVLELAETQFVHLKLGVLFAQSGAPEKALEHLSRAFDMDSQASKHFSPQQFEEGTYWYAFALSKMGRIDEAKQMLSLLLQNDPSHLKSGKLWTELNRRH